MHFYPGDAMVLWTANVLVQLAVVVVLAWAVTAAFARHRAAMRYAVWLSALGCVLVSPLAAYLAAQSGWSLLSLPLLPSPIAAELRGGQGAIPASAEPEFPNAAERPKVAQPSPAVQSARGSEWHVIRTTQCESGPLKGTEGIPPAASSPKDSLRAVLGLVAAVWAAGVLFSLARVSHGLRSIARLRRWLRPVGNDRLNTLLSDIGRTMNTRALPRVAICPSVVELAGPITIGVFRPLVVLPERLLETLDLCGLRDVLIHEFAHALRHDPLVGCLQRLAAILYWPYPPVHFLNRKLAWAREELCDDYVLRQGDAASYAETLLAVSQTLSGRVQPAALGLFHPRGKLERRVAGLLDERRTVMVHVHRATMAALAGLFMAAIVVVAGTRLSGADPIEKSTHASPPTTPLPNSPLPQAGEGPGVRAADTGGKSKQPTPLQANHFEPFDVLQIRVLGTILDQPIDGFFLVEVDGRVALGPSYGRVNVKGLTPIQAEDRIKQKLKEVLAKPDVQVLLARKAGSPHLIPIPYRVQPLDVLQVRVAGTGLVEERPIDGFYLVEPDGRVPLGPGWGRVDVNGLTVDEAEQKVKQYLAPRLPKSPAVQVQWARRGEKWREVVLPKVPYIINPGDWLWVQVEGTMLTQPIDGSYLVEPTGTVALGPAYGRAQVQGLTLEAAEKAIDKQLKQVLTKPTAQVTLPPFVPFVRTSTSAQTPPGVGHWKEVPPPKAGYTIKPGDVVFIDAHGASPDQPITNAYLVEPAGTVALGPAYGRVPVAGLTLEGAETAIGKKLGKVLSKPEVQVTLAGWEGVEEMVVSSHVHAAREVRSPRPLLRRRVAPPRAGTSNPSSSALPLGEPSADQLLAGLTEIRFGTGRQSVNPSLVKFYPAVGREAIAAANRLHLRVMENAPAVLTVDMRADETPTSPGVTLLMELKYTTPEGKHLTLWKGSKRIVAVDLSAIPDPNADRYKRIAAKNTADLFQEFVDAVLSARTHAKSK
jgi:protein involved in polysaccharide export with SLBB domain/beta-lactamase regulating signal transducer with metallopeptidase domain